MANAEAFRFANRLRDIADKIEVEHPMVVVLTTNEGNGAFTDVSGCCVRHIMETSIECAITVATNVHNLEGVDGCCDTTKQKGSKR